MSFGRIALAWVGVSLWLVVIDMVTRRWMKGETESMPVPASWRWSLGIAALITLFGSLWFASLGSGGWWLVFGLVGLLVGVERTVESAALSIAKGRESRVEESLPRGRIGAQRRSLDSRLLTLDFARRLALSTARYLGSGLILSLLL